MDQQSVIEDIALIKRVIEESRRFTFDNGKYYLLWGILVAVAIFIDYSLALVGNMGMFALWLWIATVVIGWIISIIFAIREPSKPAGWPIGAKLVALVWASCGVASTILGFIGFLSGALQAWAICPAIAAVMGSAYAISSFVYKLKWVTLVGIAWWIGSLCMFAIKSENTLPIFGAMMILFQAVPGFVFYRSSKKKLQLVDMK
ncbi:MAG: hypothetical protein WAO19_06775 [Candidatus Kryptoniota bacterium]